MVGIEQDQKKNNDINYYRTKTLLEHGFLQNQQD